MFGEWETGNCTQALERDDSLSWEKDEKEEDGEKAELSYHAQTVCVCIS